jgi:hypothetical protein
VVSSDRLEPGAEGRIKASIDTAGRMGRLEKYITVYSNDRRNPVITLSLTLDIQQK